MADLGAPLFTARLLMLYTSLYNAIGTALA